MKNGESFETRKPTVIISYKGPKCRGDCKDIVVYLRPETNGVRVESIIFRVIRNNEIYRENIEVCYLANLPGDFIIKNKIVEKHYSTRLYFAVGGKHVFTPYMKKRFEEFFHTPFEKAEIIGSFEALERLKMGYDELFNIWVPQNRILLVDGQIIKKYRGVFIVNYDIPAILHKNNNKTDIAVMIFRSVLERELFRQMINEMAREFITENILSSKKPLSRIFHFSKGPFEQILDGMGYIYQPNSEHIPFSQISFYRFLIEKGISYNLIEDLIKHPIVQFLEETGEIFEDSIFSATAGMNYSEAYSILGRISAQPLLGI